MIERIRYNRDRKNARKDCLYTLRDADKIFYGIARLNTRADDFDKERGKEVATARAYKAVKKFSEDGFGNDFGSWSTEKNYGYIKTEQVRDFINFFKQLGTR